MNLHNWPRLLAVALLAATGSAACEVSTEPSAPLDRITVSVASTSVKIGDTVRVVATFIDEDDQVMEPPVASWTSSNPGVLSVDGTGLVTSHTTGSALITVAVGEIDGNIGMQSSRRLCESDAVLVGTLSVPGLVTGTFGLADCVLLNFATAEGRTMTLDAQTTVMLRADASDAVPFIHVTNAATTAEYASSYFSGFTDSARVVVTLPAGTYYVWVSDSGHGTGTYALASEVVTECDFDDDIGGSIAVNQTVGGSLTSANCALSDGSRGQGWSFAVDDSAQMITFVARNRTVDLTTVVLTPTGTAPLYFTRQHGDSTLFATILPAESYLVWALSQAGGDGVGTFDLTRRARAFEYCASPTDTLALGDTINALLTHDLCSADQWGRRAIVYHLNIATPTSVQVDLTSTEVVTYLWLRDSLGNVTKIDPDYAQPSAAQLIADLPAGSYQLIVTTGDEHEFGTFTVTAKAIASGVRLTRQ